MSKLLPIDDVTKGVWIAVEYLVLTRDVPTYAVEICQMSGITEEVGLALAKSSGYRVREMNRFVRENLRGES